VKKFEGRKKRRKKEGDTADGESEEKLFEVVIKIKRRNEGRFRQSP